MIDHFVTDDRNVVAAACDAMRLGHEFRTTVHRPKAESETQHWIGYVTAVRSVSNGHSIEVYRKDI